MKTLALLILCVALGSCAGTITSDPVESKVAAVDTSTPEQYQLNDNGWLGYHDQKGWVVKGQKTVGIVFGVVTEKKRVEFNGLIDKYHIQYKSEMPGVWLMPDDGLTPWIDEYGNHLWAVDKTFLGYYWDLEQWKRDNRPADSLWLKTLNIL